MRKLSILLVLVLLFSFFAVGCKSSDKTSTSSGKYDNYIPNGATDVSAEVMEALTNSGTVSSYVFGDSDTAGGNSLTGFNHKEFQTLFREFYGGELELSRIEWEKWEAKFITDFAAEDAPDLIYGFAKLWPKIANRGMVFSRNELVERGVVGLDHPVLTEGIDTADANFTFKGEPYSIGLLGSSCFWNVVNEDLFKKYNVKSPSSYYKEGLWTFDTLDKCCTELITAAGLNDAGVREIYGYYCWDNGVFIRANGQQLVGLDNETGKITNNIEKLEVIDPLERVRKGYQDGYITNKETFSQGKIGIIAIADGNIPALLNQCTFKYSLIPFPKGKDNTNGLMPGSCNAWMVTSSSENPQGAVNLVIAYEAAMNDGILTVEEDIIANMFKDDEGGLQMVADTRSKGVNDNMYGVGSLWDAQWDFWSALRFGKQSVPECVATWKGFFDAQIEVENELAN
ncbi:MAG: extracellular solute-binding protein [Clostridia bacterium]|nr:extracellular solute-binding protein [Clostridia bacterium]